MQVQGTDEQHCGLAHGPLGSTLDT